MGDVVLIVEKDDRVRLGIRNAFKARSTPIYEVGDAFDAMSALGRASFGAVVVSAGKRQLSLRGLCQLARRRHPGVQLFVITSPGVQAAEVEQALGVENIQVVPAGTTTVALADQVIAGMALDDLDLPITEPGLGAGSDDETRPFARAPSAAPQASGAARPLRKGMRSPPSSPALADPPSAEPTSAEGPGQVFAEDDRTEPMPPAAGAPTPAAAAPPPSLEDASDVVDTSVDPLPPDEPTATGFETPLITASQGPPVSSDTASEEPELSFSLDDDEPTERMPAWQAPSPERSMPEVALGRGDQLPAPVDLPPSPPIPPSPQAEVSVPETKLTAVQLEDTASSTSEGALFEGLFEGRTGGALLMSLLAQELTGKLVVDEGPAARMLYFLHGEPVYAETSDRDAGLLAMLKARGSVPESFRPVLDDGQPIPEGLLLGVLSNRGLLSGQAVHDFLREFVRARVIHLLEQERGTYAFFDEAGFVETKPLLKVAPFGLLLEARRKRHAPDEIVRLSEEIEWSYLHPGPALAPVAEKLRPFARGANLAEVINGQRRVKTVLSTMGLDPLMGTLIVLTLEDARLVSRREEPMESFDAVELADSTLIGEPDFELPDSEVEDSASEDESQAREEIFSLYMRLKPLNLPREVLGVPLDADAGAIQSAYQDRMSALDPRRIPEGSAQQLMASRVEELRRKVQQAFEALTMAEPPSSSPENTRPGGSKTNPW